MAAKMRIKSKGKSKTSKKVRSKSVELGNSGDLAKAKPIDFPYAIRSFTGYLEGTQKSLHTIKNYRLDISAFQEFLTQQYTKKGLKLENVSRNDVARYRDYLKEKGFKINTRRRKLLTVTQFLNFLAKRKKVSFEMTQKLPAPHKVERIPYTISATGLLNSIRELPEESLLDLRNKVLLWTLAETGCLVSELTEFRYEHFVLNSFESARAHIGGKSHRAVPISVELYQAAQELKRKLVKPSAWVFSGFNKFGSMGSKITSRGVELIVKHYAQIFNYSELTPRTFRHSVILKWFEDGLPQGEIQTRLGLKTTYAFRSYEPLIRSSKLKKDEIKSKLETTSTV